MGPMETPKYGDDEREQHLHQANHHRDRCRSLGCGDGMQRFRLDRYNRSDDDEHRTTTTTPAATTTTSDAPTTTLAATTTAPPTTTDPVAATTWAVVLVAPDDVLNVRDEPLGEILFTLDPTERGIVATGMTETLDTGDHWLEVEFDGQTGWVNDRFITEEIDDASFASNAPSGALSNWAQTGSGPAWPSIVSPKGFHVIHFDPMKSWPPSQNPFLDQTVYDWGGEAAGPGQPVASDTFTNEIAASLAGVVGDRISRQP